MRDSGFKPTALERSRPALRWGAYTLMLLYSIYYFHDGSVPGNRLAYPLGWWGWWDQSQYLASARNLAAGNFAPIGHWYPLGYSIAAAPLVGWFPAHAFFFLDLAALLVSYLAFVLFARRCGVHPVLAIVVFIVTSFGSEAIGEVWAQPWNSSLSAALIWSLMAVSAVLLDASAECWQLWRLFLFGMLAVSIPLVRPTDAIWPAIVALCLIVAALRARVLRVGHIACVGAAAALLMIPYGVLYLRIYGPHLTSYMVQAHKIGFDFSRLGWKVYELLIEPRPWYPDGVGILARFPWLPLSFAGFVMLGVSGDRAFRRAPLILLGVIIAGYWAVMFAFVDLLPSGLWRYNNIHYFKWSFPGLGLFVVVFLHRAFVMRQWQTAVALVAVIAVLSVRVVAVRRDSNGPAEMVQYAGPQQGWDKIYMGTWKFSDTVGNLRNVYDVHTVPDSEGVRVLPLRRPIVGPLIWIDRPAALDGPVTYWYARLGFGYPCWLPPYPCSRLPAH